jgi:hypothetical protein
MDIGSIILGAIIGAIPSWYMSKYFASKSSNELTSKLRELTNKLNSSATLDNFEKMLHSSRWIKECINEDEVWICEDNRTFQICLGNDDRTFIEKWINKFPDKSAIMFHVHLQIQGVTIKSLPFISADGGRYVLPLPDLIVIEDEQHFCWSPADIGYKVSEIIGRFYRYATLQEVADFLKIEIHKVTRS